MAYKRVKTYLMVPELLISTVLTDLLLNTYSVPSHYIQTWCVQMQKGVVRGFIFVDNRYFTEYARFYVRN